MCVFVCARVHVCILLLSHIRFFVTSWTVACQSPLSMVFSRQKYWSESLYPTPGDLPDPGTKPLSVLSPALAGGFFINLPPGKPIYTYIYNREKGRL